MWQGNGNCYNVTMMWQDNGNCYNITTMWQGNGNCYNVTTMPEWNQESNKVGYAKNSAPCPSPRQLSVI